MMRGWVLACSVCFGDPSSASSKGVVMGVLFLMGVVGFVLAGVALWILVLIHRSRNSTRLIQSQL